LSAAIIFLAASKECCNMLTMSDLCSINRAASGIPDLAGQPRQLVFLTTIDTPLHDFLREAHQIALFAPEIVERIDQDLDLLAKRKKLLRLADAQFHAGQTPDLPRLEVQLRAAQLDELVLEQGRPRTEAYVVYLFLMLRGFLGGCKDQRASLLVQGSITLRLWLEGLGLSLPPASTLSDNLNAVSNPTRDFILAAQLRYTLRAGLDDFGKCFIDSTGVEANSARPTDASLLVRLLGRICAGGARLGRFDLPVMNPVGLEVQLAELQQRSQQIHFLHGKGRAEAKRQRLFFQLLRRVRRLRVRLLRDLAPVRESLEQRTDLPPSRRLAAQGAVELLAQDLADLETVAEAGERRVLRGEKVPMAEKIVSLSDADAAFIIKGGWNSIVGYRPQLARSGQGLVTALVVPKGNAADSPQLQPLVEAQIAHTGIVPQMVSVDDGYSSLEGREGVLGLGVKVASVSGAKGKKLIAPALWKSSPYREARAERSAIESLMFTLKDGFAFGALRRRTRENAHAEMLEKVLAYNITQILRLRARRGVAEEPWPAAA
jgi:IS5 family transposase